jgi:hypothetical protein
MEFVWLERVEGAVSAALEAGAAEDSHSETHLTAAPA